MRVATARASYSVLSDRCIIPPFGLHGGGAGAPNSFTYRHAGVELQPGKIPGKATGCPVVRGDVVLMRSAGGGGYGDPLARDPERVHDDVRLGFVTARGAADAYGVVFAPDGAVDAAATAALRASLVLQRCNLTVAAHDAASGEYSHGRRYVQVHPSTAKRFGLAEGTPIEIVVPVGAPLRAWVRLNDALASDAVWIGAEGAAMIGTAPGNAVRLRALALGFAVAPKSAAPKPTPASEAVSA